MRFVINILPFVVSFFWSCGVDPQIKPQLVSSEIVEVVPNGWPRPIYTFSVNVVTEAKFVLGRSLFYETQLSKDGTISCGSCHQQFAAFSHADHSLSHGIGGLLGTRNASGIFNIQWHPLIMHDGGVSDIEVQPLSAISDPVEMDEDINSVVTKLSTSPKYRKLFFQAWGSEEINSQKILSSMAVFMGLMYSWNSKFDYYKRGEMNVRLSSQELRGYSLFLEKCNSCHTEPLFSDFSFRNNGLSPNPAIRDSGRARITKRVVDLYKFKVPSLRNISKTGPYMHDGRFATLKQCLDHYTDGVVNWVNLDPQLQSGGIQLTESEKGDIIAFLNTLTDYKFLTDPKFADPRD